MTSGLYDGLLVALTNTALLLTGFLVGEARTALHRR